MGCRDKINPVKKISRQTWLLILVGLTLIVVLLLAGSLRNMVFSPGHALPFEQMMPNFSTIGTDDELTRQVMIVMRIIFILGWIVLPFYVIYLIISPEARKRFLRDLVTILPFLLLLYFLSNGLQNNQQAQDLDRRIQGNPVEEVAVTPAPQVEFTADPSDWQVTLTIIGLAVAGTGLGVGALYIYLNSLHPKQQPLTRLAEEAQSAIDAIEAGGDLRDVIMRCYYEMNRAIGDSRNLKRNADMTAHEFESFLLEKGLPHEPIHNLTELFERVRYGAFEPGRQEERLAVSSLSAIVAACQRVAR